ncbi:hypothetical protein [Sinomonas susongensis]|uniref:hypothetical protein n=1 Tax=Sinomonas susongensis TaxID=1324851 RepID=UPI0011081648|nr:hypothetical protein [Sinomonas susongensis]
MRTHAKDVEAGKETSPLHASVGAATVITLGEMIVLAVLDWTQGAFETGGLVTPFVSWPVMMLAVRPRWKGLVGSFAITLLYAALGYASAANFIFLGFVFPPAMLAMIVGWSNLMPLKVLALRALGLAAAAFVAVAFMVYMPLPGALVLVIAPWLSSRAPRAALIVNRSMSVVLALTLSVVGILSMPSSVGGTAGFFALLGGIAILRPPEDGLENLRPKDPHLFTPSIFGWPDRVRYWLDGQPWDSRL